MIRLVSQPSPPTSMWEVWSWGVVNQFRHFAYVTGLVSGGFVGWGNGRREAGLHLSFHRRPYVLWRQREDWFHHVRYGHHRFNIEYVPCGTCVPWPCCEAVGVDHLPRCEEGEVF